MGPTETSTLFRSPVPEVPPLSFSEKGVQTSLSETSRTFIFTKQRAKSRQELGGKSFKQHQDGQGERPNHGQQP